MGKFSFLAVVSNYEVAFFATIVILVFMGLLVLCVVNYLMNRNYTSPCPYTDKPLRKGSEIPYMEAEKVLRFMYHMHEYDNRMFDVRKAAVCRETGKLFPDSLTRFGNIYVDWGFIQKRFPGNFVSWGSLSDLQQEIIMAAHDPLQGFQTAFSSSIPNPRNIEKKYVYLKPGPLYVDIDTKILLGWKCVPDTDFEVLIVQKPIQFMTLTTT